MEEFAEIKVTMEVTYLVPMVDENTTALDGRTMDELIKEWFIKYDPNRYHASRDAHLLGGSKKVLSAERVPANGTYLMMPNGSGS